MQRDRFVADKMKTNAVRAGPVKVKRRNGLFDVSAQLLPVVPLREDVLGKALGAIAAVGFLGDLKNYFFHTLTLNL